MPARDQRTLKRAKALRSDMPDCERLIWEKLRAKRLNGIKFARQVPIGPFIVDFAARREKLAIEIDGDSHAFRLSYDAERARFIEGLGWQIIRFSNEDVRTNMDGVLEGILRAAESRFAAPSP